MRWPSTGTCFAIVLLAGASLLAQSQAPPTSTDPEFEVVSVKPVTLGPNSAIGFELDARPNGDYSASLITAHELLLTAFQMKEFQLIGAPEWIKREFFAIQAKAGEGHSEKDVNAMLRQMLRTRFGLRAHSETHDMPSFVLTIAREDGHLGSRMKPSTAECVAYAAAQEAAKEALLKGDTPPPPPPSPKAASASVPLEKQDFQRYMDNLPCGNVAMSRGKNGAKRETWSTTTMEDLVSWFSREMDGPVVDATGLKGRFDVDMEFISNKGMAGSSFGGPSLSASAPSAAAELLPPPFQAALREQLGLKIEKAIKPVQVLVIDSVERPTPD